MKYHSDKDIVSVGDSEVGKSSIVNQLKKEPSYKLSDIFISTIRIDFIVVKFRFIKLKIRQKIGLRDNVRLFFRLLLSQQMKL